MILHRQQDRIPQELISLDMGRNAYLVQNFGNGELVAVLGKCLRTRGCSRGLQHPADQHGLIKGFDKKERETVIQQILFDLFALKGACHKKGGVGAGGILGFIPLLYRDGIQIGHKCIQQHRLRVGEMCIRDRAVHGGGHDAARIEGPLAAGA